jgi:hypothetical protein
MALPMDEQHILDAMERELAADDPKLAARLASFGEPRIGAALRTPRARALLSLAALLLIAVVALLLYAMTALRPGAVSHQHPRPVHVSRSLTSSGSAAASHPGG